MPCHKVLILKNILILSQQKITVAGASAGTNKLLAPKLVPINLYWRQQFIGTSAGASAGASAGITSTGTSKLLVPAQVYWYQHWHQRFIGASTGASAGASSLLVPALAPA